MMRSQLNIRAKDFALRFTLPILTGILLLLGGCGGSGHSPNDPAQSDRLSVVSITPAADETGVALDKEITVVFSHKLDTLQPEDSILVYDANGALVSGTTVVNQRALIFTPDRYQALDAFSISISAEVKSNGLVLGDAFESNFHTGELLLSGKRPPPQAYNPLGIAGDRISLGTIPEISIVWSNNAQDYFIVEDPPYNPSPMTNASATSAATISNSAGFSSMGWKKIPLSGQFDDDKWDETAVIHHDGSASGNITLSIIDTIESTVFSDNALGLTFGTADSIDVARTDFDADGKDEILITTSSRTRSTIDYYLVDFDSTTGRYLIVKQGSITPETGDVIVKVQVAAGDVDADGKPEVVFTWVQDAAVTVANYGIKYNKAYSAFVVIDDLSAAMVELSPQQTISDKMKLSAYAPHDAIAVTTADIDGDGIDEVLIGLTEYDDGGVNLGSLRYCSWIKDYLFIAQNTHSQAASRTLELSQVSSYSSNGLEAFEYMQARSFPAGKGLMNVFKTADLDGDGRDELLFHNVLTKFKTNRNFESTSAAQTEFVIRIPEEHISIALDSNHSSRALDLTEGYLTRDIQVGDIDGDLRDDFVFLRRADQSVTVDYKGDAIANGVWIEHFDFADCEAEVAEDYCAGFDPLNPDVRLAWKKFALQGSSSLYWWIAGEPKLALPNVDEDSLIVEKSGHTVYTSDNTIVAVLAAPPCSEDTGQDIGNCETEFGHGSTHSFEHGVYVNASAGIVAGFEWEPEVNIPFLKLKLMKIELEGSVGAEYSYQHNWGLETSELITYSAGADNNLVVFDSFVYDRYQYLVVSHPDASLIGTTMSLSVPTGKRQFAMSQDYYNATNGTQMDIDGSILDVVPGDLNSYPDMSEAESIASGDHSSLVAMASEYTPVPQGESNAVSYETGVSTSETNEHSVGAYVNLSVKGCGPDASGLNPSVCLGVEGSSSTGYAYSHTWSTDLVFAGSVTGIPGDRYAEEKFGLGLFAYKQNIPGNTVDPNQEFLVVNYYLDK